MNKLIEAYINLEDEIPYISVTAQIVGKQYLARHHTTKISQELIDLLTKELVNGDEI